LDVLVVIGDDDLELVVADVADARVESKAAISRLSGAISIGVTSDSGAVAVPRPGLEWRVDRLV
jgi:hypothetical protein